MYRADGTLILSASDVTGHVACPRLTHLELSATDGAWERPVVDDPQSDLVRAKGDEHEQEYLMSLGADVARIEFPVSDVVALEAAEHATVEAMAAGAPFVFQATFVHEGWRGHADFLRRVEQPCARWDWSYEVIDTKLARTAKPTHVLQLCCYSEQVARLQGGTWPEHAYVVLGDGTEHPVRLQDHLAHYRRVRAGFLRALERSEEPYPLPVAHCGVCDWNEQCADLRRADDHLSLVAGLRRDQTVRLERAGITTVQELAESPSEDRPGSISQPTWETLHDQAAMQVQARETDAIPWRTLPPVEGRGLALLPPPSRGDVYFDFEGDPFAQDGAGLEYLFGWVALEKRTWTFDCRWAHSAAQEKAAFTTFMDWLIARRAKYPDLHVYHYANYEQAALKRLAGRYGVREDELDVLLREEVFVDLYQAVRQGVRIGLESYSLKEVEHLYMAEREAAVTDAGNSIVEYERWLEVRDDQILEDIRHYNEEDCQSTRLLRDWLLALIPEAESEHNAKIKWVAPANRQRDEQRRAEDADVAQRVQALLTGLPEASADDNEDERASRLLAAVQEYHAREFRASWWPIYMRREMPLSDLLDDPEALAGLAVTDGPEQVVQSWRWQMTFPPQEHKVEDGRVIPVDGDYPKGTVEHLDNAAGTLSFKRGMRVEGPLPTAIMGGLPRSTKSIEDALADLGDHVLQYGLDAPGEWRAAIGLLRRDRPRVAGLDPGADLQGDDVTLEQMIDIALALDESTLFVQGPPGSGKTWRGARVIVALLDAGKRVAINANAHRAIHNLLHEVERVAHEQGVTLRGCYKGDEYASPHGLVQRVNDNDDCLDPEFNLLAGTVWLLSRTDHRGAFDHVVVDEAGQVSLANALAVAGCARNMIVLGDPRQLPHVSKATHPDGSGVSALTHLLGEHDTVPPDRGLFLSQTRRLHPDVCAWVSEIVYDGRLHAAGEALDRRINASGDLSGTGLRLLAVEHEGNRQASTEEATVIAAQVKALLHDGKLRDGRHERKLTESDVLVVAAYNRQVACLREHLPAGVRVGTVDKFQGLQAPVVFFSMAASTPQDIPRGIDFLYSRNRLNVALSRAQCLAVLVASPSLLDVDCNTVSQMVLANALCRAVEIAGA